MRPVDHRSTRTQTSCREYGASVRALLLPLVDVDLGVAEQQFVIAVLEMVGELERGNVMASASILALAQATRRDGGTLADTCQQLVVLLDD